MVDGQPIGKPLDGLDYLKFLIVLKKALGPEKSVSIAAPAFYWYLKAFPIGRVSVAIDYIVYMIYDLHGQWDYGNRNTYDMCPSSKCVRSHVNLTETLNALSMSVANNKIFVDEASYGRSFHMAKEGCWVLDMATTAAQMAAYLYPNEEISEGAFSWWLSPCGGTNLVPDDIKKAFGILSQVANGESSFKPPKKLKKGSGKKGDDANPRDRSIPRSPNNNNNNN
ncbi:glycoside hydrolase superfamily [Dendryphion nanum]|uniref:Glycoside hydrolase superfamily n=1 Tax=Dendryphion nanum TaxID=256645 RepID=A0A9P9IF20_9PLEO|nr:glycoside hydrolase superfamily [Dendryphion nanum]